MVRLVRIYPVGRKYGNAIVEYFNTHENWDRNGNGRGGFILLQGMQTFSDTINRSSYSLAAIEGAGYELGKNIGGDDVTERERRGFHQRRAV